jgi:hypothetical protein
MQVAAFQRDTLVIADESALSQTPSARVWTSRRNAALT